MTDQPRDRRSASEDSDRVNAHCQSQTLTSDFLTLEVNRLTDEEREALRNACRLETDEAEE